MSYVINEMYVAEVVVEKSRFIGILCPLTSDNDFELYFSEAKKTFKDARHYTYALRYQNIEKASDDGEPANTAGLPLLNLLKTNDFSNTLLIVVRYFGGKKLGAGRLLRTYVETGVKVINQATKYMEIPAFCYEIIVPISDYERVKHYLVKAEHEIIDSDFSNLDVIITVNVSKANAPMFESIYNIKSKSEAVLLKEEENE
jgi:uncharacterized YigZ family protein